MSMTQAEIKDLIPKEQLVSFLDREQTTSVKILSSSLSKKRLKSLLKEKVPASFDLSETASRLDNRG